MTERALGMRWDRKPGDKKPKAGRVVAEESGNVVALWPDRWPVIALQECIDLVEAAPPKERAAIKFALPCSTCPKKTACLNAKRKELGPLLFSREILTEPQSSESSLFPRGIWDPLKIDTPCVPSWIPPFSLEHEWAVVQAWDIAYSEKVGGDWLVCITAVVHLPTGQRRLLDIERWQRIDFDDQIDLIELKWKQFGAKMVVIETDAAQVIWAKRVVKTTPVPVVRHTAGEKRNLRYGVPSILIDIANEKWEIPWVPGSLHHDEVENLISEFSAFGWNDGKLEGVGEHDDTVMAFWHLSYGIERLLGAGGQEHHSGHVGGAEH